MLSLDESNLNQAGKYLNNRSHIRSIGLSLLASASIIINSPGRTPTKETGFFT